MIFRSQNFGNLNTRYENCRHQFGTSEAEDIRICLMAIEDPSVSMRDITDFFEIDYSTVRRRLRSHGLYSRIAAKKTMSNERRKAIRINYCNMMLSFNQWLDCKFVFIHDYSSKNVPGKQWLSNSIIKAQFKLTR